MSLAKAAPYSLAKALAAFTASSFNTIVASPRGFEPLVAGMKPES